MKLLGIGVLSVLFSLTVQAQSLKEGKSLKKVMLSEVIAKASPGTILVLGEEHNTKAQADQHMALLEALEQRGLKVSLGMEFFDYTLQGYVDAWRNKEMEEAEFLRLIDWGVYDFKNYSRQALFPKNGNRTLALNLSRSLTTRVARDGGLGALTELELALLPPDFKQGNELYRQRFYHMMQASGHVIDPQLLADFFTSQSLWDDTMAWKATEFMASHPDQVLVVIIGQFHSMYGGGFPDRLRARGAKSVMSIFQMTIDGASSEEIEQVQRPDPIHGPLSDYIWES